MLRLLECRDDLICYAITSQDDLPLSALVPFLNDAWEVDAYDKPRLDFDESFLQRLMGTAGWVAVMICTEQGTPMGFELASERTLYCRGQTLQAYYNTLFSVAPTYRRRGIGRWILHHINRLLFDERGADVVFAAFDPKRAGLPTTTQVHKDMKRWELYDFHLAPAWSRRLDVRSIPAVASTHQVTRIACDDTHSYFMPLDTDTVLARPSLPSAVAFADVLRAHHQVAFGIESSFAWRYLHPALVEGGTFFHQFEGAWCWISFEMIPVQRSGHALGPLGQIQAICAPGCHEVQIYQALQHLCQFFQAQHCVVASLFDYGVVPPCVLRALSFQPTGDKRIFTVRGAPPTLEIFQGVTPPYFLDL